MHIASGSKINIFPDPKRRSDDLFYWTALYANFHTDPSATDVLFAGDAGQIKKNDIQKYVFDIYNIKWTGSMRDTFP